MVPGSGPELLELAVVRERECREDAVAAVVAAEDGTWSTSIVVPPGTPSGSYAVNATCTLPIVPFEASAQAQGTFQCAPGAITIAGPAAIAIPAAPTFTG